ncbi:LPXTG cell wall anchor domain-containing protein [Streptomyces sp. NPDC002553]|uniref:LPXTG cell wall anchor domain-containing protein n=1 Tax=Streptomyces sp. NPDC002553 TaxID=3154417 RepID=UPI0033338AD5
MRFTYRTGLGALAVAGAALLATAVPASADGPGPTTAPTAPAVDASARPTPVAEPATDSAGRGQVGVVPRGAADTGAVPTSEDSTGEAGVIGAGVAAVFLAGGAGVYFVRRQRTTGA